MIRHTLWCSFIVFALFLAAAVRAAEPVPPTFVLEEVIALAVERNPAVMGAEGAEAERRGQRVAAGAYPNPKVTVQTGRGAIRDPSTGVSITEYVAMFGQSIEWPLLRRARRQAADAALQGASAGVVEARLNLIADVKVTFYGLLLAQREAELARQNLVTVEEVARAVNARVRSGEAPQFEAIKAEVEVLKASQVVSRARNQVRVARVLLDTLTSGALGTEFSIKGDFQRMPGIPALEGLVARALDRHPTLRRLSKLVERADRTIEKERQARVPTVTVNGLYWREVGREAYGAIVSVPTPLWYQRQGEIAEALGGKRREEAELLRARNELVRGVNQHFQEAKILADQIELFERGLLRQAQEALRIAQFSFRQGASSLLEVLDAQRVFRQTQVEYARTRFDLSAALVHLERAVGGTL